jgi:hypothetical protein
MLYKDLLLFVLRYIKTPKTLCEQKVEFLGTFAKLQKRLLASSCLSVSQSACLPVCLSVRMEQLGSHWTDFHEILYLSIFPKYVEKIHVSSKSVTNNGYFT